MKSMSQTIARQIDPARRVGDLAQSLAGAARTFEKLGIDYCCQGNRSLSEAAALAAIPLDEVMAKLALAGEALTPVPQAADGLCDYIVQHHHTFTREALHRLAPLGDKVLRVHGEVHPELRRVRELLDLLADDLEPHMVREERVLFPYIVGLAKGHLPAAPFGRIEQPLSVMHHEHEQVGDLLRELELVTGGYELPAGACASYGAFYAGLKELQVDLHQHIHLENNVLFPMALALEQQLREA